MVSGISGNNSNVENGIHYWEKNAKDVNNIDETYANARDLGYVRLNYSRLTAVGKLSAKYDSSDMYKVTVQSNGKMAISLRDDSADDKVLDLSKYDQAYKELLKQTDPDAYDALIAKEDEETAKQKLLSYTAPGMKVEVFQSKNGRQVLVGDSSAKEDTDLRKNLDSMLTGDYKATKGDYYIKVSRDESMADTKEMSYAMQVSMGDKFKHEYAFTEAVSDDTKNKTITKISAEIKANLNGATAMSAQAARNQSLSQMLQLGYMGMSDIYSKNSKF